MATTDINKASIPELIAGLVGDAKDMAAGHGAKMRDEIKGEFKGLKNFLMRVLVAVGLGILGAILLSHAFALGLDALGVPQWAAYLISAVIFVGIGALLVKRMPSDKSDIDLVPETALAGLKRDANLTNSAMQEAVKEPGPGPAPSVHAH
ncbi:MAG TPA: phage holin family protein [Kofleriaceae bacterium]|nr:phage holin family protein [Kofleriaceae bacterium]